MPIGYASGRVLDALVDPIHRLMIGPHGKYRD
jgi:hypothetical protein